VTRAIVEEWRSIAARDGSKLRGFANAVNLSATDAATKCVMVRLCPSPGKILARYVLTINMSAYILMVDAWTPTNPLARSPTVPSI